MTQHDYTQNPHDSTSYMAGDFQAQHEQLQQRRVSMALTETRFWLYLAPLLAIVFLVINAAQAYWSLSKLANMATDSLLNMAVTGGVALALVLAANVIAANIGSAGALGKITGGLLLVGLMAFSVTTSGLHLAWQVQGGHEASITNSKAYRRADYDYQQSVEAMAEVRRSASLADTQGDTASAGYIRSKQLPAARQDLLQARERLDTVAKGGDGVTATVLAEVAAMVGLSPQQFSTRFSLFAVILMELCRIWLTLQAVSAVKRALEESSRPKSQAPQLRAVA